MHSRNTPPLDRGRSAARAKPRPGRGRYFVFSGLALVVFAGVGLTYAWSRSATPVSDSTGSLVADECKAALGYPARTDSQLRWLRQCASALSPGATETMPPLPPPTTDPDPTGTTTPPTTAPTPPTTTTAPRPPAPGGPVVHGRSITTSNTGYLAWVGSSGQRCTDATLKVYTTKVNASQLGNATCVWLKQGLNVDAAITLTAARIDSEVNAERARLTLNWSTVDATGEDWAVGYKVDSYRSQLVNGSDGVRFDDTNIVESYVRVRQVTSADHNDGVQAYMAGRGGSILRSNIDGRPVNAPSIAGNAAVFFADNSRGEVVIRDNWLVGGGYTLRLHESNTYRVTGNVLSSWMFGPYTNDNAIAGAFLEFANNTTSTGGTINNN